MWKAEFTRYTHDLFTDHLKRDNGTLTVVEII